MRLNETTAETAKANATDAATEKEGRRRLGSGLIVAFHAFVVAYAVFAVSFDHWGPSLGWMPATIIAAAFGWFGYCLPWIGDAIVMLWNVLSIFT
jgi:fatty acid desaturase